MKKLNLRIPALLLVVILIMAFAIPAFAANSSDVATTAAEAAGGLSTTAAKALGQWSCRRWRCNRNGCGCRQVCRGYRSSARGTG